MNRSEATTLNILICRTTTFPNNPASNGPDSPGLQDYRNPAQQQMTNRQQNGICDSEFSRMKSKRFGDRYAPRGRDARASPALSKISDKNRTKVKNGDTVTEQYCITTRNTDGESPFRVAFRSVCRLLRHSAYASAVASVRSVRFARANVYRHRIPSATPTGRTRFRRDAGPQLGARRRYSNYVFDFRFVGRVYIYVYMYVCL